MLTFYLLMIIITTLAIVLFVRFAEPFAVCKHFAVLDSFLPKSLVSFINHQLLIVVAELLAVYKHFAILESLLPISPWSQAGLQLDLIVAVVFELDFVAIVESTIVIFIASIAFILD